jgi:transcriptional regulator NrdR family protein
MELSVSTVQDILKSKTIKDLERCFDSGYGIRKNEEKEFFALLQQSSNYIVSIHKNNIRKEELNKTVVNIVNELVLNGATRISSDNIRNLLKYCHLFKTDGYDEIRKILKESKFDNFNLEPIDTETYNHIYKVNKNNREDV